MDRKVKSYLFILILAVVAGFISNLAVKYLFDGKIAISTLKAIMSASFVVNIMVFVICSIFKKRLKKNGLDDMP
jgi:di/tricarboxylate transporter